MAKDKVERAQDIIRRMRENNSLDDIAGILMTQGIDLESAQEAFRLEGFQVKLREGWLNVACVEDNVSANIPWIVG
jgi:hypothetical protein